MVKSLVINAGSSSIKFQVFDDEISVLSGMCDSIGLDSSFIKYKFNGEKFKESVFLESHEVAFEKVVSVLNNLGLLDNLGRVIHRVVHGGEKFKSTAKVTEDMLLELKKLIPLAPLHNPANIKGIKLMQKLLPNVPAYAVFDTAFHTTMPEEAYLYGVPYSWYKEYGVRRYGFHGTSHQYVIGEAIRLLGGVSGTKILNCHLGNGASLCAAIDGKSIDTSMGMTPLEGNLMGTRSGTIDPGIISYMVDNADMSLKSVVNVLNKESGLKGLSEISSDMRPLEDGMHHCPKCKRAMGVYLHRLVRLVGAHILVMGGIDAICFTGGAGEKSAVIRKFVADKLKFMGLLIDDDKNEANFEGELSLPESKIKMFLIPTNEELQMVRNCKALDGK